MARDARRAVALALLGVALLLGAVLLWSARGRGGEPAAGAPQPGGSIDAPSAGVRAPAQAVAEPAEGAQRTAAPEIGPPEAARAQPLPALRGRVVEACTGAGVPGALVGGRLALNSAQDRQRAGAASLPDDVARTDATGAFALARIGEKVEQLVAAHFDHAPGAVERPPEGWSSAGEVVIRLERGPHVFGTALTDAGDPAAGVVVRVFGPGWPRGVFTTADSEGSYRTPAVWPGPIDVVATPPRGRSEVESGFTTDWRTTEIGAADLRVDFGPSARHVVWRGRVLDETGAPLQEGELALITLSGRADVTREQRRVATLREGRFELAKLRPGVTYRVELRLAGEPAPLVLDEVRFDAPGAVERDLHLASHALSGVVVDRESGAPVARGGGLSAVLRGAESARTGTLLDDAGRFRLRGLPSGIYDVYVSATGYASAVHRGVRIGDDARPPEPLRIEVTAAGRLRVRLAGHTPGLPGHLEFETEGRVSHSPAPRTDAAGAAEGTWTLAPGVWTVRLRVPGVGRAERTAFLERGGEAEVLFLGSDLEHASGLVAVAGTLLRPGGEPVDSAQLLFFAQDAELPPDDERQRRAATDAQGRFRAEGFAPGRWRVRGVLASGDELRFDDLVLPVRAPDPVPLHLVVPEGRVRGRLADALTGAPFAADGPAWWAFLQEAGSGRTRAELQGGHQGAIFELAGVPAGRCTLRIRARGYFDLETPAFDVGPGEQRDLGELRLRPSAVLALDVRGPEGAPIDPFSVRVDGAPLQGWRAYDRSPGRARWDGFTAGLALVEVSAPGMVTAEQVVDLEEGNVAELRFDLSAKSPP